MPCPACQHENRPQANFCEKCATPLTAASPSSPPAPSYAAITSALSEALEQQLATAELLQSRDRELAEAHEQQTATSEILRVIARSPTSVQPVFDTIAGSARQLCEAEFCVVHRFDGQLLGFVAHDGLTPAGAAAFRR